MYTTYVPGDEYMPIVVVNQSTYEPKDVLPEPNSIILIGLIMFIGFLFNRKR